jgi:hypothetical protein
MRYVYVDEAGQSEPEPVTVVVGIIVHADLQLELVQAEISRILDRVPAALRKGFVFHAKTIWGNKAYRDVWPYDDRLQVLKDMMSLPRRCDLRISYGRVRRDSFPADAFVGAPFSRSQLQHAMAFSGCLARADRFIRLYADPRETAAVVAEDLPEMRKILSAVALMFRDKPMTLRPEDLLPTEAEQAQGFIEQDAEFRITKLRGPVHFVQKQEDPLLQVADACAYALRRYFSGQTLGAEFIEAMLGMQLNLADFRGPSSYGTLPFRPSRPVA